MTLAEKLGFHRTQIENDFTLDPTLLQELIMERLSSVLHSLRKDEKDSLRRQVYEVMVYGPDADNVWPAIESVVNYRIDDKDSIFLRSEHVMEGIVLALEGDARAEDYDRRCVEDFCRALCGEDL